MVSTIHSAIQENPFGKIYWFARYLMNNDQFGAVGKSKEDKLLELVAVLENLSTQENFSVEERFLLLKNTLLTEIKNLAQPETKRYFLTLNLAQQLDREIKTVDDVIIFCVAMKYVVAPINRAIALVPADDKKFCETAAKNILDTFGEEKIHSLIATWDDLGVKACLDAERALVVEEFIRFTENLSAISISHDEFDDKIMLTAFVQEFERRLGQKRKARGGTSLETVTDFIFDYYGFKSTSKPSHFDQDIEVDKWFKCKDGWIVGISCKRTLRERWKQLSQADRGTLSHFKIRELWHLMTFDNDLSDEKIVRLGEQGQVFYLSAASETYKRCSEHPGMKTYVRPLNNFVGDIRKLI
ncbi:MAG: hypothetical protein IJ685_09070 [Selenomonadaceae bacterium]|nr:hypothetical protein [Selenomonadaceae bacterium]